MAESAILDAIHTAATFRSCVNHMQESAVKHFLLGEMFLLPFRLVVASPCAITCSVKLLTNSR